MAGGGESGLTDSLLETPTYVLSIVFMMFLAISGAFEITHHFAHKMLVRRGRLGMAEALDKLVMELTLLGFVSLILTAFSSPLSHMCVDYDTSMDKWTMESSIQGCPCCLASTGGLSYCALIQHDCTWNVTDRTPFCECNITGTPAFYNSPNDTKFDQLSDDCLVFDTNEVTFFIESSVNTLATLSVFSNISVTEICGLVDAEYDVARVRQDNGLEAELAAAGIDPAEGIILPWEESSGFRRRLTAHGSGSSSSGSGQREQRQLRSAPQAAAGGRRQPVLQQPAAAVLGPQPLGPQYQGRRLLAGGDMGDRVTDPLNVLAATRSDPDNPTQVHVLPRAKLFKCTGPFLSSGCPDGKVPAISANALHQVHIWLFLLAITHVVACVFQFLVAAGRIWLWRRWERLARQAAMPRSRAALAASKVLAAGHGEAEPSGLKEGSGKVEEPAPASANGAPAGDALEAAASAAAAAGQAEAGTAASTPAGAPSAAAGSDSPAGAAEPSKLRPRSLQRLKSRARFVWKFKPADIHEWGVTGWLMELGICLVQALWPNLVTRGNFVLMRKAWLAGGAQTIRRLDSLTSFSSGGGGGSSGRASSSGEGKEPPNFVGHVLDCLEGDLSTFVGLSVEMGICLVVVVLLMGVTGNIGGVTLVFLACSLMLGTNVALVALLRHQCRGARPNRSRRWGQWWRNPHFMLAIPLRLLTFLCSFVFSSTAFFAWQFGTRSCFFTSAWGLWSIWSLPWWSGLVIAGIILLWSSAATIPAYALAAHSHRRSSGVASARGHHHASHGLPAEQQQPDEQANGEPRAAAAKENGSADAAALIESSSGAAEAALQAEVGRLQAQVAQLEAHVAQLQARLAAAEPQAAAPAAGAALPAAA